MMIVTKFKQELNQNEVTLYDNVRYLCFEFLF